MAESVQSWRFEKRVTLGDLLTAAGMLMLGAVAYFNLREDVAVQRAQATARHFEQQRIDDRQDRALNAMAGEIRSDLAEIRASIGRIADREHGR